jgi:hypothetical protein
MFSSLLLDAIIAVIIFTQMIGCTTTSDPEILKILNDPGRYRVLAPTSEQIVTKARVPSLSVHHYLGILRARVEWSNGYEESKDRFWNAERGKRYIFLALELNPEQKSEEITVEIRTLGDELPLEPLPESLREPRSLSEK